MVVYFELIALVETDCAELTASIWLTKVVPVGDDVAEETSSLPIEVAVLTDSSCLIMVLVYTTLFAVTVKTDDLPAVFLD